jgi:hypothetical protein
MAVQHVVTLAGIAGGEAADQRYEFAGDFLQSHYGLTTAVGSGSFGPSYLPPLERAVAEVRTQAGSRTRGFHAPTVATGLPEADGGTGVTQALTNVGSLEPGNVNTAWISNQAVGFTLVRSGTTVTYTMGSDVWSHTAASVAEINALQFRLRSTTNGTINNGITLSNVTLTQGSTVTTLGCSGIGVCGTGLTGAFTASAGDVHINLFDGISGDFGLAGNWAFDLTGGRLNGNNAQIKLLSVPGLTPTGAIPEPASWAMLIAGFGLIGATLRRRRAALA